MLPINKQNQTELLLNKNFYFYLVEYLVWQDILLKKLKICSWVGISLRLYLAASAKKPYFKK